MPSVSIGSSKRPGKPVSRLVSVARAQRGSALPTQLRSALVPFPSSGAAQAANRERRQRSTPGPGAILRTDGPMNFLAHLLLAGDNPEHQVGQVLADLVSATDIPSFAPGIQAGIRAHQRIDVFTDAHPAVETARRRLRPPHRRFAGILLDVYFDHFLARHWDRHGAPTPLASFARQRYATLASYADLPVPRYRRMVTAMQREDWLVGYSAVSGVTQALRGISARCSRPNPISSGTGPLLEDYAALRADFEAFLPTLKNHMGWPASATASADAIAGPSPARRMRSSCQSAAMPNACR